MRVAIIGGGASGMMAALSASQTPENEIILLERQARLGRKLLATGNGRCNLSNTHADAARYHGGNADFVRSALARFDTDRTLSFFRALGLHTVTEPSGRIYPFSNSANSVADVLRLALESRPNVRLLCAREVTGVCKKKKFFVETSEGRIEADRLILACGGMASGKLGATTDGYAFARSLGHHCTKLYPCLVPLKTDPTYPRSLKGVRAQAEIALYRDSTRLTQETGEIQFTEYGLSGPAIFDLSRHASVRADKLEIRLDFAPQLQAEELEQTLLERIQTFPALTLENLLTGMLHNRLGRTVLRYAGYSLAQPLSALRKADCRAIAAAVKDMRLPVTGTMGMDAAQVTAGGVCTDEFDPKTLESRLVPGLYAAGEVLDVDGDCGGFNLQWAWSSGYVAGQLNSRRSP